MLYLGSFPNHYRKGLAWWEVMRVGQRLLISISLAAIDPSSAFRTSVTVSLLCASMCAQFQLKPWKRRLENVLEPIGFAVLVLTSVASQAGSEQLIDGHGTHIMTLVASITYLAAILGVYIYSAWREPTPVRGGDLASAKAFAGDDELEEDPSASFIISGTSHISFDQLEARELPPAALQQFVDDTDDDKGDDYD